MPPAHAATESQCAPAEKVIFSCSTGMKTAVCANGDLSGLNYRFGPPGKPEMVYPTDAPWRNVTRSGMMTFSGGGGAWLAFHHAAFRTIVYTAIGRGWGEKAGLVVEHNGKMIVNLACRGKPVSELASDFFSNAGITDDDTPFGLP